MKRWLKLVLGTSAAIAAATAIYAYNYPVRVVMIIDRIKNPIAASHPIDWARGPEKPGTSERPPNIIVIVADDLGINDLTATGTGVAGKVPTPNIDSIARDGAMFDVGYTANATCSPSRAALMTGRYGTRFGFEYTSVPTALARGIAQPEPGWPHQPVYHSELEDAMPPLADQGLPADQITIAQLLRTRGYHTIHLGKWHLGESPTMRPEARGFDESLGFVAGASKYGPDNDPSLVSARLDHDPIDRFLWEYAPDAVQYNGGQRFHVGEYMTDYFAHQASTAITANRNRPFFMYLAFNAPHTPFQAKRSDYDALAGIADHKTRVYGAMIRALDRGVGDILAALKRTGNDRNTMIMFVSDNGGAWYAGLPDINKPYRGWKATFFEGGIRTPFFVRWPDRIAAGGHVTTPAHHVDVFATAAAAAGAQVPTDRKMDGISLLDAIAKPTPANASRTLFWRSGGYRAVRAGNWKLQIADKPGRAWLFDLASDPTERNDLSAAQPERVQQLRALLAAQDAQLPKKPLWPALIEAPVRIDVPSNAPWRADQQYIYWSN